MGPISPHRQASSGDLSVLRSAITGSDMPGIALHGAHGSAIFWLGVTPPI